MGFPEDVGLENNIDELSNFVEVLVFYGAGGKLLGNPMNPKSKIIYIKATPEEIEKNIHFDKAGEYIKEIERSAPLAFFDSTSTVGKQLIKLAKDLKL